MYTITVTYDLAEGTYTDTYGVATEEEVQDIRNNIRANVPVGSSVTLAVEKNA